MTYIHNNYYYRLLIMGDTSFTRFYISKDVGTLGIYSKQLNERQIKRAIMKI